MRTTLLAAATMLGFSATGEGGKVSHQHLRASFAKSYEYERTQDYANAIKALAGVHRDNPQDYTTNLRLGWLHYLDGKHANSVRYYEQAIKVAPGSVEADLGHMVPLLAQERYAQVETIANKIIKVDYCNYYANLRLAYALRMQKKHDQAEKVASRMLVLYPTDVKFLTEMALTKLAQGDEGDASELLSHVLLLDPENVTATEALANQ